jgi:hypothetical protein
MLVQDLRVRLPTTCGLQNPRRATPPVAAGHSIAMSQPETEMSDVYIVLHDEPGMSTKDAAEKLKGLGLILKNIDEDDGVIEGIILSDKLKSLEEQPFVKYVRDSFNYSSQGENEEAEDSQDVDDVGA